MLNREKFWLSLCTHEWPFVNQSFSTKLFENEKKHYALRGFNHADEKW